MLITFTTSVSLTLVLPGNSGLGCKLNPTHCASRLFVVLVLLLTYRRLPKRSAGIGEAKDGFKWQSWGPAAHTLHVVYEKYSCGIYTYTRMWVRGTLPQAADQCNASVS